jgi:uncharacterized protein (DUF885 family)
MIDRRRLLLSAAAGGALAASGARAQSGGASAATGEAAKANAIYDQVFAAVLKRSPQLNTNLGLDRTPAGAWALDKMDDNSRAAQRRAFEENERFVAQLKALDRSKLTGMDAVNYDTIMFQQDVAGEGFRNFRYGAGAFPQAYVVNQLSTVFTSTPDFLNSQHKVENARDAEAFLSRISGYARQLDDATTQAREDAAAGAAPPDFVIDRTLGLLKAARDVPAAQNSLVASIDRRTKAQNIPGDWAARAARLIEAEVNPALDRQMAALQSMRPNATHDAGVWRLPNGEAYYNWGLKSFTTTTMTGEEVHQMGLQQVAELSSGIDAILKSQGVTQGTVGQRLAALAKEQRFLYPNTDEAKERLLADLNKQVQVVTARLPDYFGTTPKTAVEVKRVPKEIEAGAPGGYYQPATLDGSRPGAYYINLRDTAEWPTWTLPTLTYHESNPGHHWQIALAREAQGLPMLRKIVGFSAYSEGWALYAEQLADEVGAYEGDPFGKVGYLQSYLFRAVRLVVDSGIHHKRWSREQAIRYMVENLGNAETAATTEIERYCVWPGQACSYKVGQTKWLQLRDAAKTKLGPKFDIKGFHDAGLLSGAMPLAVLERVIDQWVATRA